MMNSSQTHQENRQLEFVIEHDSVHTTGSTEPGCDLIQEVGVKDEEQNTRTCMKGQRHYGKQEQQARDTLIKGAKQISVVHSCSFFNDTVDVKTLNKKVMRL